MPVILESNNQNACVPFVHNNNQMPEQIIISIPSNPLSIPLVNNPSSEHEFHTQSIQMAQPGISGAKDMNNGHENLNTTDDGGELVIDSPSTRVYAVAITEPREQMVNAKIHQHVAVHSTLNKADTNGVLVGNQNTRSTVAERQTESQKRAAGSTKTVGIVERKSNPMTISTSQTKLSNSQRKAQTNHNGGLPFPNFCGKIK